MTAKTGMIGSLAICASLGFCVGFVWPFMLVAAAVKMLPPAPRAIEVTVLVAPGAPVPDPAELRGTLRRLPRRGL